MDFWALDGNGQLHAPGALLQWEGSRSIPLTGDLDMVAKGKNCPCKVTQYFCFFIFVLSLMSWTFTLTQQYLNSMIIFLRGPCKRNLWVWCNILKALHFWRNKAIFVFNRKIFFGYEAISCRSLAFRTTGVMLRSKGKYLLRNSRDYIEPYKTIVWLGI
jgi:hypothetical protein